MRPCGAGGRSHTLHLRPPIQAGLTPGEEGRLRRGQRVPLQAYEAAGLFALWVIQFAVPSLRQEMLWVYGAWITIELVLLAVRKKKILAFSAFGRVWQRRKPRPGAAA